MSFNKSEFDKSKDPEGPVQHSPNLLELISTWLSDNYNYPFRVLNDPNQMDLSMPLIGIIRINEPQSLSVYVYPNEVSCLRHIITDRSRTNAYATAELSLQAADPDFFKKIDKWLASHRF